MNRVRSPNYPAIDLEAAIELADQLFGHAQFHALPLDSLNELWGFKPGSTHGKQCVAALKAYGLVKSSGSGKKTQLAVTKTAAKIIEGHSDKRALLEEAALSPKVNREVWDHFKGDLPPDEALNHYLLFDHQPPFNKTSIPKFIKVFRTSIEFADLDGGPEIGDEVPAEEEDIDPLLDQRGGEDFGIRGQTGTGELNKDQFSLPEGVAVLVWPSGLSQESFEDLKDWLEIVQRKIRRSVPEP